MKIKTLHGYKNNVRDEFERIKKDLQHFKDGKESRVSD